MILSIRGLIHHRSGSEGLDEVREAAWCVEGDVGFYVTEHTPCGDKEIR